MRSVYTANEMQALDEATFQNLNLPSCVIMENAGRQVTALLLRYYNSLFDGEITILCGPGNNGGDGFVIARTLKELGYNPQVVSLKPFNELRGDSKLMAHAWSAVGGETFILTDSPDDMLVVRNMLDSSSVIIDAIFGTGFSGSPRALSESLITLTNDSTKDSKADIFSIDIPSGANASTAEVEGVCIEASATIAIQCLKVAHVLFPGAEYAGSVIVADVGICEDFAPETFYKRHLIDFYYVSELLKSFYLQSSNGHKGTRGHVLLVGGAKGRTGAIKLGGNAALLAGAGLATLAVPDDVKSALGASLDELMCESLVPNPKDIEKICDRKNSIVIGPGLGQSDNSRICLDLLLKETKKRDMPLVLDADALNIIADSGECRLHRKVIITPHPGEAGRLLGISTSEVQKDRLGIVKALYEKYKCVVVLKGARTLICSSKSEVFINPVADDTLGTAGSGDVLAGVLGAMLARGIPAMEASIIGVFLHGVTGEMLSQHEGLGRNFLASELSENCAVLIHELTRNELDKAYRDEVILPSSVSHADMFYSLDIFSLDSEV